MASGMCALVSRRRPASENVAVFLEYRLASRLQVGSQKPVFPHEIAYHEEDKRQLLWYDSVYRGDLDSVPRDWDVDEWEVGFCRYGSVEAEIISCLYPLVFTGGSALGLYMGCSKADWFDPSAPNLERTSSDRYDCKSRARDLSPLCSLAFLDRLETILTRNHFHNETM